MSQAIHQAIGLLEDAGKYLVKTRGAHVHAAAQAFTATDASESTDPDIQALAIFSVLLARVTGAQDDGWVATVEQNLQRAWGASNVIVGIPAPLPAHIPDFTVQNEGTIYILYAQTDAARAWVNEHLPTDRTTWGGNGTVIEHRYITDIIDGIKESGLSVR
jgi:hypothetical protein